jgi:Bacterial Ig-like domain (group 3)
MYESLPPGDRWLIKSGTLQESSDGGSMAGPWSAPGSSGHGTIDLTRAVTTTSYLGGLWKGMLTEPNSSVSSYLIHLDLTQTPDGDIQGTEDIPTQGSHVYSAEIQLSGLVIGHEFIFQETLVTDENSPPDFHWLLKAANFQVSTDGSAIDGPWSAPSYNSGTISLVPDPNRSNTGGPTATTLQIGPETTVYGQPVTLSAFVSPTTDASGSPTGQITFRDGSTTLGTAALSAGSTTFTVASLSAGPHSISAVYDGDSQFDSSTSQAASLTVTPERTSLSLTSSANPSGATTPVSFTAKIIPIAPGAGVPAGTVVFSDGSTTLGAAVVVNGSATFTTSGL